MSSSRLKVVFLGTLIAGSVVLTSCSSSGSDDSTGALELYTWASGNEAQFDFYAAAASEATGVEVPVSGPSFGDYWTQIRTQYSGGGGACLVGTQPDRTAPIASILAPLDDLIADSDVDPADFNGAMIEGLTVDGELKGLPYDASTLVLYYNAALFADAGLDVPGEGFTTAEFDAAAAAITGDDTRGFAYGSEWFWFAPFVVAAGETWATADGQLDLTNDGLVSVLDSYLDLAAQGYANPLAAGETATQQDAFMQGNVGMIVGGSWDYPRLAEALGEDVVGVASIPSPDGTGKQFVTGSGFGIAESCEDKATAFEALAAMTSAETQTEAWTELGITPSRDVVREDTFASTETPLTIVVQANLANGQVAPAAEKWDAANTLITQYLPEGFSGALSAAELLDTVQSSVR